MARTSNIFKKPPLLTTKEVSELLRIQRAKVYDLVKQGVLDGFKIGADWRIKSDSVEKLIGPLPTDYFQPLSLGAKKQKKGKYN
ncbi:MAG: DNA-binding protein [Candidatus Dadabacteria bacterium]|nr:MAG: DNA-binding protein [Candidatus Dadabacteria bacterium]